MLYYIEVDNWDIPKGILISCKTIRVICVLRVVIVMLHIFINQSYGINKKNDEREKERGKGNNKINLQKRLLKTK